MVDKKVNIKENINHGTKNIAIFEIGKIFSRGPKQEKNSLGIAISGLRAEKSWYEREFQYDIFDLKGILETLLKLLGINYEFKDEMVFSNKISLGSIRDVKYDVKQPVYFAELDIDSILKICKFEKKFISLPKYPQVKRDLSMIIEEDIKTIDIMNAIRKKAGNLLCSIEPIDIYEERKSLTFSLVFEDTNKTLKDEEINLVLENVAKYLENNYRVKIRKR